MNKMHDLLSLFASHGLTVGSVESLTGGAFASAVCDIPGASEVFKGALVTYSAELKTRLASVDPSTIEEEGVVSAEVAKEMAVGGKAALGVDICVSCTGNAGPGVEEGKAPVGRVYLGLCYEDAVWTIPLDFEGERNDIRKKTVAAMVSFLLSLEPIVKNLGK